MRSLLLSQVLLFSLLTVARPADPAVLERDIPYDHGGDPNVALMKYAGLKQVPEHPPARTLAPLGLKDKTTTAF